ncbi:MAG: hypothetical protein H5U13_11510 [Parvibaculum sp.]|nr:hypothetical protein [Parvibaculum sp.]
MTKAKARAKVGWNGIAYWSVPFEWGAEQRNTLTGADLPPEVIDRLAELVGDKIGQRKAGIPSWDEQAAGIRPLQHHAESLMRAILDMDEMSAGRLQAGLHKDHPDLWKTLPGILAAVAEVAGAALTQAEGRSRKTFASDQIAIAASVRAIFEANGLAVPDSDTGSAAIALAAVLSALNLQCRSPRYYFQPN